MTRFLRPALAAVMLFALVSCAATSERKVFVVEKTNMYHTADCGRIVMANAKPMTIEDAKAHRYRPCPDCRPDRESAR